MCGGEDRTGAVPQRGSSAQLLGGRQTAAARAASALPVGWPERRNAAVFLVDQTNAASGLRAKYVIFDAVQGSS